MRTGTGPAGRVGLMPLPLPLISPK
jgi:hypothetical protein